MGVKQSKVEFYRKEKGVKTILTHPYLEQPSQKTIINRKYF